MATKRLVASRSARNVGQSPKTIDEYIASVPEPARDILTKMRSAIRSAMPAGAIETISYRMPAYKLNKVMVWFAAFQNHCSLFPGAAVLAALKDELNGYTVSKGTVQFSVAKPLPVALVKKLVKTRLEQAGEKSRR